MKRFNKIIIVDDNKGVLDALKLLLSRHFEQIITLSTPVNIMSAIDENKPECILLDMNFKAKINTGNEGIYWLHEIKSRHKEIPVILLTAYGDIELAVRGIKEGATDFIIKPWDNDRLTNSLFEAIGNKKSGNKKHLNNDVQKMYWGDTEAMAELHNLLEKTAPTDANILITGENGTGKEVLAREVHRLSQRSDHSFTTIDMGALSETLFESELFGHTKGAFTGATSERIGKMESAKGGTLFLDEIANLPLRMQSKLLVAIQSRTVVPLGSNTPKSVDVRLICATNADIDALVSSKQFREDLLYRINTICLHLPPLRQRVPDIVPLAKKFMDRYSKAYSRYCNSISANAEKMLKGYHWPGNIRELQHMVEKAVIVSEGDVLDVQHFMLPASSHNVSSTSESEVSTLAEMERSMIIKAISECNGNLSMVASKLGITRQTLYNKMKRFDL